MVFPKDLKKLCTPALLYLTISVAGILFSIFQNIGNLKTYNLGLTSCKVPSTILVFLIKVLGIALWTWVLNLMCEDGYPEIAWFFVLLPFVIFMFAVTSYAELQKRQ